MKILFYLPVVTPWWFDNLVIKAIQSLSICAEIHVIIGLPWNNTGILPEQLSKHGNLMNVKWHLFTASDQESFRTNAASQKELIDFVANINADITICRSAEIEVTKQFPGHVRYFMEADFEPLFQQVRNAVFFHSKIFEYGNMPTLSESEIDWLSDNFEPFWHDIDDRCALRRNEVDRQQIGLPLASPVIALPLEYRHEENYFSRLTRYQTQTHLISDILRCIPNRFTLAVSEHPLNYLLRPRDEIQRIVGENRDRVVIVPGKAQGGVSTLDLIGLCDGVVLENSKCISMAAFYGTPICRLSPFTQASWLNCYTDLEDMFLAINHQQAKIPERDSCRIWLSYHVANNLIYPEDLGADPLNLIGHILKPHDPSRWSRGIERYRSHWDDFKKSKN